MRTFVALIGAKAGGGRAKPARLLCGVASAALAVLATAGASQAGGGLTLSLSASTLKVLYTHPVTFTGRLSSHQAGRSVTILAQPYLGTEIQERGVNVHDFVQLLLDDSRELESFLESVQPGEGLTPEHAAQCQAL